MASWSATSLRVAAGRRTIFSRPRTAGVRFRPSRACKGPAGEGATHEPNVTLGQPECIANVTGAITIDITALRVREGCLPTLTKPDLELRDQQGVADADHTVPVHITARRETGCGGGRRRRLTCR